jgi:DNA repair protein RadC
MKAVILANAASVIFVHNHLSLELCPSSDDIAVTRRLRRIASLLQVKCLDHFIVGPTGYFSFVENDMWPDLPVDSEFLA